MRSTRLALACAFALTSVACLDMTDVAPFPGGDLRLAVVGPVGASASEEEALRDAFDLVRSYAIRIIDTGDGSVLADTVIAIQAGQEEHSLGVEVPEESFGRTVTITLVALDQNDLELYSSTLTQALGDRFEAIELELEIRYTGPGVRGTVVDDSGGVIEGVPVNLYSGATLVKTTNTGDDGTYVFGLLSSDVYDVEPAPTSGFSCPAFRTIDATNASSVIIANFRISSSPCDPVVDVLVVSGGDFDDTGTVETLLANNASVTVTSFFFVNALPTLETLSEYDVVLAFMNGLFDESAGLGDRLAEYVAVGGNVVFGSFYWQGRSDSGLDSRGWGALEALDPFLSAGGATYTAGTLDGASITAHPLTNGLTALTSIGYRGGATAKSGTTVVASWDDGAPLIGYRTLTGGQRMVGVTLFPGSDTTMATGDVATLWGNALAWAGEPGGPTN